MTTDTGPYQGFHFTAKNPEGFLVDVFVKTRQNTSNQKSRALVERIIHAQPDWFTEAGTRTMYANPGTVRADGTIAWSDYIWSRLRRAEMTMKWYDSLNRMEISISGNGWSCARWEDKNKVVMLEV